MGPQFAQMDREQVGRLRRVDDPSAVERGKAVEMAVARIEFNARSPATLCRTSSSTKCATRFVPRLCASAPGSANALTPTLIGTALTAKTMPFAARSKNALRGRAFLTSRYPRHDGNNSRIPLPGALRRLGGKC